MLALIKAHAFLNLWHRETIRNAIIVNEQDVEEGFSLYEEVSTANELGLPPEIYNIFSQIEDEIPEEGSTRKELQAIYYQKFHRTVGKKRLDQVIDILQAVGLLTEEKDSKDGRLKRFLVTPRGVYVSSKEDKQTTILEKINTSEGVSNSQETKLSIFNLEETLRKSWQKGTTEQFCELIQQKSFLNKTEAERLVTSLIDQGKLAYDPEGWLVWVR